MDNHGSSFARGGIERHGCVRTVLLLAAFLPATLGAVSISSPAITAEADDSFSFTIGTGPAGSPPSSSLIYGFPGGVGTSDVVLNIDGTPTSPSTMTTIATMQATGSGLGATLRGSKIQGDIRFDATYTVVDNPSNGMGADTIMMEYRLRNTGLVSHNVGVRVEMDTMINGNDGANLSVTNGFSVVSVGTVWQQSAGSGVPQNWWGYDVDPTIGTPNLVARGHLYSNGFGAPATPPDAFEITSWGSVVGSTQWTTGSTGSTISDSAAVVWWTGTGGPFGSGITLAPGQEITLRSYYGVNSGSLLITPSPTFTPAPPTPTPSATPTASPFNSPTITQTFTVTPTFSPTPTITATPTISPTFTISPTATVTPTQISQDGLLEICGVYPTPFSETGKICYGVIVSSRVEFTVYNVAGEVLTAWEEDVDPGYHQAAWRGDNQSGAKVASGIYLVHVKAVALSGQVEKRWATMAIIR